MNTLSKDIAQGSIADKMKSSNISMKEAIANVDAVIMVDTSGSMEAVDFGNKSRYERAVEALEFYQQKYPGKILVMSFSTQTIFCPNGKPIFIRGSTDIAKCLDTCLLADSIPDMVFVLISDGAPDSEQAALIAAKQYKNKIHTVFIGLETDKQGQDFLHRLSAATGGQSVINYKATNIIPALSAMLMLEG